MPGRESGSPWDDAGRAAAVTAYCAVGAVALTVWTVAAPAMESSYGPSGGGLVVCLFPVLLVALWAGGVAASLLHALPAAALGHALSRRTGLPRALCCLAAEVALAAVLAAPAPSSGLPYLTAWCWIAAAGAAPVLAASFFAVRPNPQGRTGWPRRKQVAFQISVVGVALVGVVFAGGLMAYGTGLVKEYEPPVLDSGADYAGTWHDEFDGVIRFSADGTFTAQGIREYDADASGLYSHYVSRSGPGTWRYVDEDEGGVPGGLTLAFGDGGSEMGQWSSRGTQARPVLYQEVGDPDRAILYLLRKDPAP
ncbi:hypothetical protein ACIP98_02820 [Streptomyces sp. NPDC088354]|uniref:hypothetical protein n=1 Tax=Streptomyces sp. NPDC088354 TaxID=3365856 RepID=UPI00380FDE81